ncbi:MAG: protease modulator HflK [Verrucomicrobiota bacterium]|jgi:membrane protease subunit HflK
MDAPPSARQPPAGPTPPEVPVDAGSQALAEALRSSFVIIKFVMVVLVAVFLASGFFTVGPQQQALILRFGRPVAQGPQALLGPGLHWSFPYPIDEAVIVSISGLQQVKSTVGWYATTPEQELAGTEPSVPFGTPMNPVVDGCAITADANIIHTRATLTYHISDPVRYVFGFVNASNTMQNALDNALLYAASRFKVDDILVHDVFGFKDAVRRRATGLIEQRNLGVAVEECVVQSKPPRQLQQAFQNVLDADVKRSRLITDARGYEIQTTNRASAEATSRVKLAESERARFVADISSRAKQFQELLPKYNEHPSLFVQQRLAEALGRALTNVQDKLFLTESAEGQPKELRLMLNREPAKPKAEATKP